MTATKIKFTKNQLRYLQLPEGKWVKNYLKQNNLLTGDYDEDTRTIIAVAKMFEDYMINNDMKYPVRINRFLVKVIGVAYLTWEEWNECTCTDNTKRHCKDSNYSLYKGKSHNYDVGMAYKLLGHFKINSTTYC